MARLLSLRPLSHLNEVTMFKESACKCQNEQFNSNLM